MSHDAQPIVVGVDGSDAALAAAKWAASLAEKLSAPVELVNGMPGTGRALADAVSAIRAAALADHRERATLVLKQTEEELRSAYPGIDVLTLRADEPVDQLLAARSATARLVVVGSELITPSMALLVGSTTLAVGARATCPVVAWRGAVQTVTDDPVVLGVDGAHTGAAPFEAAFEFAHRVGAGVKAVHAWAHFTSPATNPLLIDWGGLETLQWDELMTELEPWTNRYPHVPVTYFVEPCGAAEALLRHANQAQLVVVGNRRKNALAGALLGSTSLNMLHHCPVPVMLCHTPK
jgi:nucleotide-binding universal stress UspA family protein